MHHIRDFLSLHLSLISGVVIGIFVGTFGGIGQDIIRWCWRRWVKTWRKRAERRKLLDTFTTDAMNFVNNMPRWLSGDPAKHALLFPKGPKGVSKLIGPEVMGFVSRLQEMLSVQLQGFGGLFSFSKRQRAWMEEVNDRLSVVGAGVKHFGTPMKWDDEQISTGTFDIAYVQKAWSDLSALIEHKENDRMSMAFFRAMRLRFRFFSIMCPKFPARALPPRTNSKGVPIKEYFGPLNLLGKFAT